MKKELTVIIPVYNDAELLEKCLISLMNQSTKEFDVLVVDDWSTDRRVQEIAKKYFKVIKTNKNDGPAKARNFGLSKINTNCVAFTDSDCQVAKDWVELILKKFKEPGIDVIMGNVKIPKSTYIGDSISCLGFPAGGWVGYDVMFGVDKNNYTNHLSSCNCALRKKVFEKVGYFDESFPTPGREDTEFSVRLISKGYKIKYCENIVITHVPRTSIKSLIKMNINRGRGTYHIKKKIPKQVMQYYKDLRYKSTFKIFKKYMFDIKFPMIVLLTIISYISLQCGLYLEKKKKIEENKNF